MGMCIVKVDRDPKDDRYLVWATVTDYFIISGTRREVFEILADRWGTIQVESGHLKRMLDRADADGSSSELQRWAWDSEGHDVQDFVTGTMRRLPRANLSTLWDRMHAWSADGRRGPLPTLTDLTTETNYEDD